ncbi:MAG: cyanobactin biosynthesis PatC/TenC/TruC family protein [Coleofasciculus chthonoplastes F3-SA18-01]|uniref:cyanobactin biosynthesis PatC/TenC/TruC family protein n=1 Tax=Coleofasciculus chthonoplastes TaxID=64178 RepID=UPI0032FAF8AC
MSKKSNSQQSEDQAAEAPPAKETPQPEPQKSYVATGMTGLQDYSYWWDYARKEEKKSGSKSKSFRRGRIWA